MYQAVRISVSSHGNTVQRLEIKCDNNEQYHRRLDLRLNNIPLHANGESSQGCLTKVKNTLVGIDWC